MNMEGPAIRKLTLKEFNLRLRGYLARQDREWDRTRHQMSYIRTFAGMGSSEFVEPKDVYPLASDKVDEKKMIKTTGQALRLLKEFE